MKRPRWLLREATAASSEPALQRGGANPQGVKQDADGDYDGDGQLRDCPDCTAGVTASGDVCPTCKGAGRLKESQREKQLLGLVEAMTARLRESSPERITSTFAGMRESGQGAFEVVLIREGKGNSEDDREYTRHAVQELVSAGVCEGMQAYADHPSLEEESFLPERSVRDLVGTYSNVTLAESEGRAEARAIFTPVKGDGYEWVTTLAEEAVRQSSGKPIVGISLYGAAAGEDRNRADGSFGPVADLIRPTSGDIVTNAGAGGQFIRRLMESARAKRASNLNDKEHDIMQLPQLMTKIRESAARLREADTDEKRTAAIDELATLADAKVEVEKQPLGEITEQQLKESQPQLLQKLRESATAEVSERLKKAGEKGGEEKDAELATLTGKLAESERRLRESEGKVAEKDKTIGQFNAELTGAKVLREAKVPEDEAEFYFLRFREAGAKDEDAMKAIVKVEQEREQRQAERLRESMGLGFVEGNPGTVGQGASELIDLSGDGVPMVEPAKATA